MSMVEMQSADWIATPSVTDLGEFIGQQGRPQIIATVSPMSGALALYCYRRGHLKGIGLAIASTATYMTRDLAAGGTVRPVSRGRTGDAGRVARSARQKITLASARCAEPADPEEVEPDDRPLRPPSRRRRIRAAESARLRPRGKGGVPPK
jgi:hypothetical protein